jgi:hypothetical protein
MERTSTGTGSGFWRERILQKTTRTTPAPATADQRRATSIQPCRRSVALDRLHLGRHGSAAWNGVSWTVTEVVERLARRGLQAQGVDDHLPEGASSSGVRFCTWGSARGFPVAPTAAELTRGAMKTAAVTFFTVPGLR